MQQAEWRRNWLSWIPSDHSIYFPNCNLSLIRSKLRPQLLCCLLLLWWISKSLPYVGTFSFPLHHGVRLRHLSSSILFPFKLDFGRCKDMSVEQTLSFVVGTVLHVMRFFFLCFSEHTFHPCASFPLPTYSLLNSLLLLQMIFAFDGTPPSLEGNDELCPPSLRMLINDCWAQHPQQRPMVLEVSMSCFTL